MIRIHGENDNSPEYQAAERLAGLAAACISGLDEDSQVVLEIFPSAKCFGQKVQDIDLLVFFANYRKEEIRSEKTNTLIHSFCASFEVKGHSPNLVRFEGNRCFVKYNDSDHDVTTQSDGQKYSIKKYIEKNSLSKSSPWITNFIWLERVQCALIPKSQNNILGSDVTWGLLLEKVALLSSRPGYNEVRCFSVRTYMANTLAVFSNVLVPSKIDRKRLEAITRSVLDRTQQQYAEKLGRQLLIFRGRGGTGKTVRLIRMAYQAYDEFGLRVVLLTYNKALVADLRRLLTLLGAKDSVGEGSISIKTIHSFMREWLLALGFISKQEPNFLEAYEEYKKNALEYLLAGAVTQEEVERSRSARSRSLTWDLLLIDESQDWPATERDLIYQLYGPKKVIIADGVDQFVRGVEKIDWRANIGMCESQIVPLRKSLRLKSSLCQTVGHFAKEIDYANWNLEPLPESHGGKVIVVVGDPFSKKFHSKLVATARDDGNKPIDILFCVPPGWVETSADGQRRSKVGKQFAEWGLECWDAVDPEQRDEYPTSLEQFRIVQYESCRGLEGWVVVNFALDEFFSYKQENAKVSEEERDDIFYDEAEAALEYARKWVMIPLTRAIDTLVIHVSDPGSYIGRIAIDLHRKYPDSIDYYEF
ncbi:TPA: AAA family ATPase [Pseudomonas aeruginosa]|uniref:AAA family ATPase n=1 Tax=Pseudomonas aeruginosa TaxID=287 RepID=UPI0009A3D8BB|nr:AAA family ATPase [Pseudomonas aeruginosa]